MLCSCEKDSAANDWTKGEGSGGFGKMENSPKVLALLVVVVVTSLFLLSKDWHFKLDASNLISSIQEFTDTSDSLQVDANDEFHDAFIDEAESGIRQNDSKDGESRAIFDMEEFSPDDRANTANTDEEPDNFYINVNNISVKLWPWTQQRKNILFLKIPKTGGTTLADNLARLANHTRWWFTRPTAKAKVNTCGKESEAEVAWARMVNANGGRLAIFALHACFRSFMKTKKFWTLRQTPVTISLIRNPWDHYISKYRFAQVCCERVDWTWCETLCPKDTNGNRAPLSHTRFLEVACKNGRCNEQRFYLGSGVAEAMLEDYKVVLILERLDEGLALLATKVGLPFRALPYLRENRNMLVKKPNFTEEVRKMVMSTALAADLDLYHAAEVRFDRQIATLSHVDREFFDQTLGRLRRANTILEETCESECEPFPSLSKERKTCDHMCVERVLDEYHL